MNKDEGDLEKWRPGDGVHCVIKSLSNLCLTPELSYRFHFIPLRSKRTSRQLVKRQQCTETHDSTAGGALRERRPRLYIHLIHTDKCVHHTNW